MEPDMSLKFVGLNTINLISNQLHHQFHVQSSFSVIHKVGKIGIFYCFNYENEIFIVAIHLTFNLKYYDKCKFAIKLIPLATTSDLFSLEVLQQCQHCQLCVLRENSIQRDCII